jgi:DNA-directed RNA polymerase subunit M/transcription elongation factor TFIIS
MDEEVREKGKEFLSNYVSLPKNIIIIEKNIYNLIKDYNEYDIEQKYFNLIYEIIYLLNHNYSIKDLNEMIKKGEVDWNNKSFEMERKKQTEKDEFITNPFEAHESVEKCPKCGGNKTYSYQRQVRSSDEGFSTFSTCFGCGNKWRIN